MANLQLKVDYFLDERIKVIVNTTIEGGDTTHVLLFLASKVIRRKEYDGRTITVDELKLCFERFGPVLMDRILTMLVKFDFITIDRSQMITVLENELWDLV